VAVENRYSSKQGCARAQLFHTFGDYEYTGGAVLTPCGIVAVYYQPASNKNKAYLRLDFVHEGRCFTKVENRSHSDRGIVTVAHRFARETRGDKP
jgi:hypothetical protein